LQTFFNNQKHPLRTNQNPKDFLNMIAKPLLTAPLSGWIVTSMENESYPTIPIKVLPPSNRWSTSTATTNQLPFVQFGWSDLPCQGDDFYMSINHTSTTIGVQHSQCTSNSNKVVDTDTNSPTSSSVTVSVSPMYELRDYIPHLPPPSPTSCCCDDISLVSSEVSIPSYDTISSSSSSVCSTDEEEDTNKTINTVTKEENSTGMQQHRKKHVSFAPLARVRVHTIVLGDHPMCTGGMALQLGWESSSTQYIPLRQNHQKDNVHIHRRTAMNQLRLSYSQRRQRLQELTGLTTWQLLQQEYLLMCCQPPSSSSSSS
jgi:hypothetical protein